MERSVVSSEMLLEVLEIFRNTGSQRTFRGEKKGRQVLEEKHLFKIKPLVIFLFASLAVTGALLSGTQGTSGQMMDACYFLTPRAHTALWSKQGAVNKHRAVFHIKRKEVSTENESTGLYTTELRNHQNTPCHQQNPCPSCLGPWEQAEKIL